MKGTHYLKSKSSTQKNVTLSSAEAELLAAVKASGEAPGMLQLMSSVGVPVTACIMVDSSAALAAKARKGNVKLRHVRVGHLWVQQVAADEGLKYHTVNGEENPGDACTKHLTSGRLRKLFARVGQCQRSGRAQESLRVQTARSAPADSPGCIKHQGKEGCQHISTSRRDLSPGRDPVAVYCAKTLARLQSAFFSYSGKQESSRHSIFVAPKSRPPFFPSSNHYILLSCGLQHKPKPFPRATASFSSVH